VTKSKPPSEGLDVSAKPGQPRPGTTCAPVQGPLDLEVDSDERIGLSVEEAGAVSDDAVAGEPNSWDLLSEDGAGDDDIELTDDLVDGYEDEYELSEELLENEFDSLDDDDDDTPGDGSLRLDEGALEPLPARAGDSSGLTPPTEQMEEIPDGPLDSVQLELAGEDDGPDEDDNLEVEAALLDGLEIEPAGPEEWTSLDEERSDPFHTATDPATLPELPLVNPYSGNYTPVGAADQVEDPLDLDPDEEGEQGQGDGAPLELEPDDAVALDGRVLTGQETSVLMNEPDADWIDPMDAEDEVEWLREEAHRLSVDDQIDEELSVLDRLMRLVPGDAGLAAQYEDVLARVIQVYFPGKTPDSIPVLTVQAWELPDLVRDPALGAILGRMDGHTPLREIYSVLPDQEPGTVYRLLSRAKGKGLVRLDQRD